MVLGVNIMFVKALSSSCSGDSIFTHDIRGGGGGDGAETDPVRMSHFRHSLLSFPWGIPSAQEEFLVASQEQGAVWNQTHITLLSFPQMLRWTHR